MARGRKGPLFGLATLCGISHRFSHRFSSYPLHRKRFDIYSPVRPRQQSSKLLPVTNSDLHVCKFNLSRDQTLQFKFDAQELNFVIITCSLLRLVIHFRCDVRIRIFGAHTDCPDKLLRTGATRLSAP